MILIGLDVGTQGVRVIACDEKGTILSEVSEKIPHADRPSLPPGWSEQDAETWWERAISCLRKTAKGLASNGHSLDGIRAIGVTSTSGTVVALDSLHYPLCPAIMYNDCRATEEARGINEIAGAQCEKLGCTFQASFALPKILWLKEHHPEIYDRTKVFLHAADFLTGRLTGDYSTSDLSNVMKAGYDIVDGKWPSYIGEALGIDVDRLPQHIVRPGEAVGALCRMTAADIGLPAGIPVVAAGTDSTAALIASGAVSPGESSSTLGTTLAVKNVSSDLISDPAGRVYCQVHPDGFWLAGGASSVGGECLEKVFAGEDLKALDRAASERSPTSLYVYPLVRTGERFPFVNRDARGFTVGEPVDRAELFAGYLEGVAFVEKWCFESLEELGCRTGEEVHVTGGGTRSREWLQIRANVLNKPLVKPVVGETAFGAAILAASNTCYGGSIEAAARMVTMEAPVLPLEEKAEAFTGKYQEFRRLCSERSYE